MRLIGYGPGELLDRLTILGLKIAHDPRPHFLEEAEALTAQLDQLQLFRVYNVATLELGGVNSRIWHLEDKLRGYQKGFTNDEDREVIAETALLIQRLNDRRADLIRQINLAAGASAAYEKVTP